MCTLSVSGCFPKSAFRVEHTAKVMTEIQFCVGSRSVCFITLSVASSPGKASKGPIVPHPEEPGRDGGVLRASVEGSLPLGRPAEPTAHGELLLGHGQCFLYRRGQSVNAHSQISGRARRRVFLTALDSVKGANKEPLAKGGQAWNSFGKEVFTGPISRT